MNAKYKVNIIESERGWGQKVEDCRYFDSKEEADDFVQEYNKDNNEPTVPDWYMFAKLVGLVDMDEE